MLRISQTLLWLMLAFMSIDITAQGQPDARTEIIEGLRAPTNVMLYSINPSHLSESLTNSETNILHGYRVIGSTVLNAADAKTAIDSIRPSISAWAGSNSRCGFQPRHGLRIISGSTTNDILLCYHCGEFAVYEGDQRVMFHGRLDGKPDALNQLLAQAKIPIAKEDDFRLVKP